MLSGRTLKRLFDNCHCEERSDEAISNSQNKNEIAALPELVRSLVEGVARNDIMWGYLTATKGCGYF